MSRFLVVTLTKILPGAIIGRIGKALLGVNIDLNSVETLRKRNLPD